MRCPSCGESNSEDRKFCASCGVGFGQPCPRCGFQNKSAERYCGGCGTSLVGSSAATPQPLAQSFRDGRYRVLKTLGEGGSKIVYLAHDQTLGRDVAISAIKTAGLDDVARTRIAREARAMAQLGDHPSIVTIYDIGEEAAQPYIVSQFMAGGTVADLLRRSEGGHLPTTTAIRIASEVCDALEHAHSHAIVHRDVKPANIFLTPGGASRLADFGLALASSQARLTSANMMVGTVAYMPPEQARGAEMDARSDIYSLGVTLFEMLT